LFIAIILLPAPDYHLISSPRGLLRLSTHRCVGGASGYPTIGTRIVSSAAIPVVIDPIVGIAAPDNHFTATPNCCVKLPTTGGVNGCGSCPTIRTRIIFAARVHCKTAVVDPAPDDHFAAGSLCCLIGSASVRKSYWWI